MPDARRTLARAVMALALAVTAGAAWRLHADAWDLGGRSPVLSYDAAQYAVAARELAEHGRFATPFALPVELARHPSPPWPLALVQPGLVLAEAAVLRVVPPNLAVGQLPLWRAHRPDQREWLLLLVPFACFVALAVAIGLSAAHLLASFAPEVPDLSRAVVGAGMGLLFVLDPEAQHYAVGGFTELPFTLLTIAALAGVALGRAARFPLVFGLLLGAAGLFRGVTLWIAPLLALAAAASAEPRDRARVLGWTLGGWVLVLAPWWIYKWRVFGDAGWDLSRWSLWDGVEGRTWFSLFHTADPPVTPTGGAALRLLGAKLMANLPKLALTLSTGLGALWAGALVIGLAAGGWPRTVRAAAAGVLALALATLVTAGLSVPLVRYLFPARIAIEAAGALALGALVVRHLGPDVRAPRVRAMLAAVTALALGWGAWRMVRGLDEARTASAERGTPSTETLMQITVLLERELEDGEPVMSNLGPVLAWSARRPVVHLALSPEEIAPLRRRLDVSHVVLVFRDAERAWPGWSEVVARPEETTHRPEWNVRRMRRYASSDGFTILWLDLGPATPTLAADVSAAAPPAGAALPRR